MKLTCSKCDGRGWVNGPKENTWAEACPPCGGLGRMTVWQLAARLGEDGRTLIRLSEMRVGARVAERVLSRLTEVFR